jgi:transcriptional regulator with XRE-family HTH domain
MRKRPDLDPRTGYAVRAARVHQGLSVATLATASQVPRSSIMDIESGIMRRKAGVYLARIAEVLPMLSAYLAAHEEEMPDIMGLADAHQEAQLTEQKLRETFQAIGRKESTIVPPPPETDPAPGDDNRKLAISILRTALDALEGR